MLKPTPEQEAILLACDGQLPIMVDALAGTGKTTTLVMMARRLRPGVALAFNVKIKKELEQRFPEGWTVLTLNGLGHRAWAKAIGKRLIVDEKKLGRLVTEAFRKERFQADPDTWDAVRWTVSQAMQQGLVPDKFANMGRGLVPDDTETWLDIGSERCIREELVHFCREVLIASIAEAYQGNISFDDQVYMSAMFNGVFPRFPTVLVDEAQDLSPLNHIMVKRTAGPDGRLVVVGDPNQAIYAFRGADSNSMAKLRALRPEWIELPLATTFRCPHAVVKRQHGHVPNYRAAEANAPGQFIRLAEWDWDKVQANAIGSIAVLCRNNAPLIGMAFKLIRSGVGCHMLGRDIGKGLKALAKKLCQGCTTSLECKSAISEWYSLEHSKAIAMGEDSKADRIEDQVESLQAILDSSGAEHLEAILQAIDDIFSQEGKVTLSTGHRAKGLEWDTVVHLDPWRLPSKFAQTDAAKRQEANLRYVVETRAKHTLIEADSKEFH